MGYVPTKPSHPEAFQIVPSAEVESYTFDKSHNAAEGVLKEGEGAGDRGLRAVAD